MKVLIICALIGVTIAGEAFIAAPAPIAYSSFYTDELKPGYEYSTSVNTANYNNYAHVRSGGEIERKFYNFPQFAAAPIFAEPADPIYTEAKLFQPAVAAAPIFKPNVAIAARADIIAAAPAPAIAAAAPAVPAAAPATKLVPLAFEAKFPFYRFIAPATYVAAEPIAAAAAPAAAFAAAAPAAAFAAPAPAAAFAAAIPAAPILAPAETKSQYHSQNEFGEATYGHREPFQAHDAVQDAAGNKAGSFSYVAPDGRLLTTEYVADQAGYRVASNALPQNPLPVAEVKPAEATADAIVVEAKSRSRRSAQFITPAIRSAPVYTAPQYYYPSYSYPYSYSYAPYYSSPYYRAAYSYPYTSSNIYYKSFPFRK